MTMHPDIYSTCPFCKESALVSSEPVQGLPETVYEIICKSCGQFCILSRLLPENIEKGHPLKTIKKNQINLDFIYNHNKSALAVGKMMIWVDDKEDIIKWDSAIQEVSEKIPHVTAYAVRDLTMFMKDS